LKINEGIRPWILNRVEIDCTWITEFDIPIKKAQKLIAKAKIKLTENSVPLVNANPDSELGLTIMYHGKLFVTSQFQIGFYAKIFGFRVMVLFLPSTAT
jgi:hypothetical protein